MNPSELCRLCERLSLNGRAVTWLDYVNQTPKEDPLKQEYIDRLTKIREWNPYLYTELEYAVIRAKNEHRNATERLAFAASLAAGRQDWADVDRIKANIEKRNAAFDQAIEIWLSDVEAKMPQKANNHEGEK